MSGRSRHRLTWSAAPLLTVIALAAGLAGCGSSSPIAGQSPDAPSTTAVIWGRIDSEQLRAQLLRLDRDVQRCLRAEGYAAYALAPDIPELDAFTSFIEDDALKRRSGYGVSEQLAVSLSASNGRAAAVDPTPKSQVDTASFQNARRDCYEKHLSQYPEMERFTRVTEIQVSPEAIAPEVEADDRIAPLRRTWRKCMAVAGFTVDSPWAALDQFRTRAGDLYSDLSNVAKRRRAAPKLSRLRADELAMARADADCSEPMAATRDAVWAEYLAAARSNKLDAPDFTDESEWME
jgi:hypothetical protein